MGIKQDRNIYSIYKKGKFRDDYSLRTLAYYQREGGIYNDLITILQRIRSERGNGRIRAPHVILNLASEALDDAIMLLVDENGLIFNDLGENYYQLQCALFDDTGFFVMHTNDIFEDKDVDCVLCSLCVLMYQVKWLDELVPLLSERIDAKLYHHFAPLIEGQKVKDHTVQVEALEKQLQTMGDLIREKDDQLAQLSRENSIQRDMIDDTKGMLQAYMRKATELTLGIDGALSLDAILEWAKKREHYTLANQVIAMLKDLGRKTATDEEYNKIQTVELELISKYSELSIVNNNMGIGSNILTGITSNPMMPMGYDQNQIMQKFIEFLNNGARRENKD